MSDELARNLMFAVIGMVSVLVVYLVMRWALHDHTDEIAKAVADELETRKGGKKQNDARLP